MLTEQEHVATGWLFNRKECKVFFSGGETNFLLKFSDNCLLPGFSKVDVTTWESPTAYFRRNSPLFNEISQLISLIRKDRDNSYYDRNRILVRFIPTDETLAGPLFLFSKTGTTI